MSIAKSFVSAAFLAGLCASASAVSAGSTQPLPPQLVERDAAKGHDKNDHDKNDHDKNDHDKDSAATGASSGVLLAEREHGKNHDKHDSRDKNEKNDKNDKNDPDKGGKDA